MKTLTINVPDTLDEKEVVWAMAKVLFEKGFLSLEQASSFAKLSPTYFNMRLEGIPVGVNLPITHVPESSFNPDNIRQIAEEMNIDESWEELVAQIGK